MDKKINKWFTLVELIVVITILAILWTIAFISFSWYSSSARDGNRVSDLNNISKWLDTYSIKAWRFPNPSWLALDVTYSWAMIFSVWKLWESVIQEIWNINKKPIDPVSSEEYQYSISKNQYKNSYELSANTEWTIAFNNEFYAKANAAASANISYIKWNYNWILLRSQTWGIYYAITMPTHSITSSALTWTNIDILSMSWKLVFPGKTNLWIQFNPKVVWNSADMKLSEADIQTFIDSIQSSYSWSNISWEQIYSKLINQSWESEINVWKDLFGNFLGWKIVPITKCSEISNTNWNNLDTTMCQDDRSYAMQWWATHDRIYSLLKIVWRWWFNENLAFPPVSWYRWSDSWTTTDSWYYSCPWNNWTSTADCTLVSTLWYIYQWSTAMVWAASNNNQSARVQWICPIWWGLPTKADFTSISDSYWPTNDYIYNWNIAWWINKYAGLREYSDITGPFNRNTTFMHIWTSFQSSATNAWYSGFYSVQPLNMQRNVLNKSYAAPVRCIKN